MEKIMAKGREAPSLPSPHSSLRERDEMVMVKVANRTRSTAAQLFCQEERGAEDGVSGMEGGETKCESVCVWVREFCVHERSCCV